MPATADRMRVLHVNDRAPDAPDGGGAEIYLGRVIAAQRDRGHDVHLFTAAGCRTAAALDIWNPFTRRRLREVVAALRPDVVHVHNVVRELSPSVLGVLPAATVMTAHDLRAFVGGEHGDRVLRRAVDRQVLAPLLRRQVRRHVARTIAVSRAMRDDLVAAGVGPVDVVPPPGRVPVADPAPPSASAVVLYAGRLGADKGVPVLLAAFAEVARRSPTARLVVIGDGAERPRAQRLAEQLPGRVEVLGRLAPDELSRLLGQARVAVVPSVPRLRREGLPLAAVEAAGHGRPLVTSDDPGAAEVAAHVGGVVAAAEDPAALADALCTYLDDPARADADGARAAAAAADYLPDAVAVRLDAVYAAVTSR